MADYNIKDAFCQYDIRWQRLNKHSTIGNLHKVAVVLAAKDITTDTGFAVVAGLCELDDVLLVVFFVLE